MILHALQLHMENSQSCRSLRDKRYPIYKVPLHSSETVACEQTGILEHWPKNPGV
jgi:hypothetical protein